MADKIPVLEKRVGITPVNSPSMAGSVNKFADATNWMSTVGSTMAQQSSAAIAKNLGFEAGKDPSGDLPPSFTDFDKHYAQEYTVNAQNTINQRANNLILTSQDELARSGELTPESINAFNDNVSEGLKNLTELLPIEVRGQAQAKYANLLAKNNSDMHTQMLKNQFSRRKGETTANISTDLSQGYDIAMSGALDEKGNPAALGMIAEKMKFNMDLYEQGLLSATEAQTNSKAYIKSVFTGHYSHMYNAANMPGALGEDGKPTTGSKYLSTLAGPATEFEKAYGLDDDLKNSVLGSVYSYKTQQDNLSSSYQHEVISEAEFAMMSSDYTMAQLNEAQAELTPEQATKLGQKFAASADARQRDMQRVELLGAQYGDTDTWMNAENKTKNAAFHARRDAIMKKRGVTKDHATLEAALAAGGPIPEVINQVNNNTMSTDSEKYEFSALYIETMDANKKYLNLMGIKEETRAAIAMYQVGKADSTPEEAAITAQNYQYKEGATTEYINSQIQKALKVFDTSSTGELGTGMTDLTDVDQSKILNNPLVTSWLKASLTKDINATKGNIEAGRLMTNERFNRAWGKSSLNGVSEIVHLPVSKLLDVPDSYNPLIIDQAVKQTKPQLEATKAAYDKGDMDYYYKVNERPTTEDTKLALERLKEMSLIAKMGLVPKLPWTPGKKQSTLHKEYNKTLKEFSSAKPAIITKISRDGSTEEKYMYIQSDTLLSRTNNPKYPYISGYNVLLRDKKTNAITEMLRPESIYGSVTFAPIKSQLVSDADSLGLNDKGLLATLTEESLQVRGAKWTIKQLET